MFPASTCEKNREVSVRSANRRRLVTLTGVISEKRSSQKPDRGGWEVSAYQEGEDDGHRRGPRRCSQMARVQRRIHHLRDRGFKHY